LGVFITSSFLVFRCSLSHAKRLFYMGLLMASLERF